jgi:hypothetical protein
MSVTLTDEDYGTAMQALRRIAADHEKTCSGKRKRLPRHQAINIAREACEALGWPYDGKSSEAEK